jgi:TIR domain-containing protein/uncharacterized protein DUF4384
MATPEPDPTIPRTFISYSWDDDAHKEWVKQLATRLRADGVDVTLDRWHAAPGDQIPAFMERAVRENDFVIAVCTPRFKERSDGRGGGVGYEGDIMTAYAFTGGDTRKFIPVLRRGSWSEAAPTWLLGRAKIDLSGDPYSESEYEELLRTLHGAREAAPPIGPRPPFGDEKGSQASPAPAPVTPLVGSSAPQHQSSVTTGADPADGLGSLVLRDRRQALVRLGAAATAFMLAGGAGAWGVFQLGRATAPPPRALPSRFHDRWSRDVLEVLYTEAPPAPPWGTARAALQIAIEARRASEPGFTRLKDGELLASRVDRYRIVGTARSPGYLYLVQIDVADQVDWLFPRNATSRHSSGSNPLATGQPIRVPATGALFLDTTVGVEHLYAVYSATRWPRLEDALGRTPPPAEATRGVVQAPNALGLRGVGGVSPDDSPGGVSMVPAVGDRFQGNGYFLILERWFRHG